MEINYFLNYSETQQCLLYYTKNSVIFQKGSRGVISIFSLVIYHRGFLTQGIEDSTKASTNATVKQPLKRGIQIEQQSKETISQGDRGEFEITETTWGNVLSRRRSRRKERSKFQRKYWKRWATCRKSSKDLKPARRITNLWAPLVSYRRRLSISRSPFVLRQERGRKRAGGQGA